MSGTSIAYAAPSPLSRSLDLTSVVLPPDGLQDRAWVPSPPSRSGIAAQSLGIACWVRSRHARRRTALTQALPPTGASSVSVHDKSRSAALSAYAAAAECTCDGHVTCTTVTCSLVTHGRVAPVRCSRPREKRSQVCSCGLLSTLTPKPELETRNLSLWIPAFASRCVLRCASQQARCHALLAPSFDCL
eukprot:348586-Rhodomonas_salina.11